ncbi:PhaM family polyhydroxyalkanoate granule multifunctional regulatory protein [Pandoraea sp. NPDC090278]|uniref:PhaM family polyhydroxyalkanoate granule multifunctional regulatory protein n=1 Tax=Pandoraea sp. NPDC090278 TaxID=3364391 RepID=UPI00383AFA94
MSDSTSAMPNGFDILKKMWEAFSPPATFTSPLTQLMQSAAPLLDPNEIENRIAEMRAVEQWLTLNLNVLRSTIQAFEVQRATYATLRAFGTGSFGATDASGTTDTGASPFGQAAAANLWRSPFAAAEPAQDVEPEPQASAPEPEPQVEPEAAPGAGAENEAGASSSPFGQASSAYGALDPSMWFNAMRAQFDQIAAAAQAAGVSAAQMTEAAAAQMSDAAAKATKASGATKAAAPSAAKASDKTAAPAKRAAPETKTASKTAAKRAPAAKKTPAKSAAAKTSAKTSAKTTGRTSSAKTEGDTPKGRASGSTGKQSAWKW